MKALIVLEHHFIIDKNKNVWCDRIVNYNFLKRYLSVYDEIVLVGRAETVESDINNKLLVSGDNVEFIPLPDFKGGKDFLLNYNNIKSIINEQIKKCDCVIYRAPTHLSLFTYKLALKNNKPLGLEFMMGANKMIDGSGIINRLINLFIDMKAKKMCKKATAVSYVTERVLQERYPCKAILEPNNPSYYTTNYSTIDLNDNMFYKQEWSLKRKPSLFTIIHLGYMDSFVKGQDILIKAFKIVVDKGYNVRLVFIGDGEKKSYFQSMVKEYNIEDKVIFKGLIKEKMDVLKELRQAHMLVLPTQSEGLPRTIIEAMAQGLPCISSPVDGIPELLEEKFLVNYDNVEGYANLIEKFLNNWELMIETSNNNYSHALDYKKELLDEKRKKFYSFLVKKMKNNILE